jgi:hypothetical protein
LGRKSLLPTACAFSAYRKEFGRKRPPRFRRLAACDVSLGWQSAYYKHANRTSLARRRKAERAKTREDMMQLINNAADEGQTIAEFRAAQQALTRAQCKALLEALAAGERTVAQLVESVRSHTAWAALAATGDDKKLHRAVLNRLDKLSRKGRTAERHDTGRNGLKVRIARLADPKPKPGKTTAAAAEAGPAQPAGPPTDDGEIPF